MPALWIGTSGWVYKHWINGVFYPPKLPPAQQLAFYAEHFPTVEVNFSFYRLPEYSVFESWQPRTPPSFLFAVKGSRFLTHIKKLNEPEEPVKRLMERASGLGEKLGPILFQFPPTWPLDLGRIEHFLEVLGPYRPQRYAFEFRHRSWLDARLYQLLEREQAALCLPIGPNVPLDVRLTAPWTYIRFHSGQRGTAFGDDELETWAGQLRAFRAEGADAYVYFNNDPEGAAIRDACRLRALLSGPSA